MASKPFPSLAATAFAAMRFYFYLKRRSKAITGGEANSNAAANNGIAGGASGAHTSTESDAMGTFAAVLFNFFLKRRSRKISGGEASNNAAANDGIAGGASDVHTLTESHGTVIFAAMLFNFLLKRRPREIYGGEANDNAAADDGIPGGDSGAHTSTESHTMGTFAAMLFNFFLKRRLREINGGEASNNAAANDGIAGGASSVHTSTESHGTIIFAAMLFIFLLKERPREINGGEANDNAAADDGIVGGDSGAHTSIESHGMGTSSGYEYEVFLSFRGPDTRERFTDFLYTSLERAGIHTFKDDENLRKGEEFAPELVQAIKQSKILVPIFSRDYASSVWCLKEVAQMAECMKTREQYIIPIFYDVAPEEVRHQKGGYGDAFLSHENKKRCDQETIREWKLALNAVGNITGYDLQSMPNRREGELVNLFVEHALKLLEVAPLVVSDYLIDVDDHVDKIMEMRGASTSETWIIGIHGMGGIGKTTIAKVIYNRLLKNFNNSCFLPNIREKSKTPLGTECLQNQLIFDILKRECTNIRNSDKGIQTIRERLRDKKVLILFDDVDDKKDMDALIGNCDFLFGKGSILIITSRNKGVLEVLAQDLYEVNIMDPEQSLQLFTRHVFRRDYPLNENINEYKMAVKIAGGLPLALAAIGSCLALKGKAEWDNILEMLEKCPHKEVKSKLKISYEALDHREKHIFCDIACLFNGYDKDILVDFWIPQLHPKCTMKMLEDKSLIKIEEDNKVSMHDQLRYLGRDIVCEECKMDPMEKKRLWDPEEVLDLLSIPEGNKKVEALKFDCEKPYCFTYEDFQRLSNLKFLGVDGSSRPITAEERLYVERPYGERPSVVPPANIFRKNSPLLPRMRWLSWHDIPSRFNIASFSMQDVIILDLSRSKLTYQWEGWSHMKLMKKLKVLDLTGCDGLLQTPIFSADSNLERLILAGCSLLMEIAESICRLKCLVSLDASYCKCLQRLPDRLGTDLASLEYLSLKHCESLERLPNSIENLESLIELDISNTRIKELPDTLWTMAKLTEIKASTTYGVERFQVNIGDCISSNKSLKILRLRCAKICTLPKLPESLVELQLSELYTDRFPDLSNLTNLKELKLRFGSPDSDGRSNGLVEYQIPPQWMEKLTKLESLSLSFRCVGTSPTDLGLPPQLKSLNLACPNLHRLPRLPSSLSSLHLKRCESLCSMKDLSDLKNLSTLQIDGAAISEIEGLGCLEKLRDLRLLGLGQLHALPDLRNLKKLRIIDVIQCGKLVEIQGELPKSLVKLCIRSCNNLREVPGLSSLRRQQKVETLDCENLPEREDCENLS